MTFVVMPRYTLVKRCLDEETDWRA